MAAKCLMLTLVVTFGGLFFMAGCNSNDKPQPDGKNAQGEANPVVAPEEDLNKPEFLSQQPRPEMDMAVAMRTAVDPKPLSGNVKKGLEYLVNQQHKDGGWGQGGGWRDNGGGARVEGAEVQDPPDVGNTCLAVLALIRAGNTPKEGLYAKNVAKGVAFICSHVEKSDDKSLSVTDVKGTQLQSKIGVYVDTFLSSMVLSELKGRMQDESSEKRMVAALTKTVHKMETNQKTDGTFAGNTGWASVLSQGLANKGFARASQNGIAVNPTAIGNVQMQVANNFDPKTSTFVGGGLGGGGGIGGGGLGGYSGATATGLLKAPTEVSSLTKAATGTLTITGAAPVITGSVAAPTDAGVPIYNVAANLSSAADVSNTYRKDADKARATLAKKDAPAEEKAKATDTLKNIEKNEQIRIEATKEIVKQLDQPAFTNGFGSNGGEEFLSFMNISEALLLKGGEDWKKWDTTVTESVSRVQDKDGSWSGQHCITGRTACTASALLVLLADRAPIPVAVASDKVQK